MQQTQSTTPNNTQSDLILDKQEDKIMAGFSFMDTQNGLLFEAAVNVDTIFPPSMNINVTRFNNGVKDTTNKLWINVKVNNFINLYNNFMDPSTYGIVEISFNSKNGGASSVHIGLQPNMQLYIDDGRTSYNLVIDEITRSTFANYVLEWHLHGAVYKDIVENIKSSLNKSISCMIVDVANQLNMQINPPKTYELNNGNSTGNNRGGYRRNNTQQNQGNQIGGNGQYRANSQPQQTMQPPTIPQMPIPNNRVTPNQPPQQIPQTQNNQFNQPSVAQAIPQMPQVPNIPQASGIPQTPPSMVQPNIPTQPQGGIPMGIPIPQTPSAAGGGINADLGKMIGNSFGGIPSGLQQ